MWSEVKGQAGVVATVYQTTDEAIFDVASGASIMFGGFVSGGTPGNLIHALRRRGTGNLTGIANNIGFGDELDVLCEERQLQRFIATFAIRASGARRSRFEELYRAGEVELELVPQGTLAERIRAGGAGLGGVLTRTGLGTVVAEGKQVVEVGGVPYLLEAPLRADFAFIAAERGDTLGNLEYRAAGRNFNPLMAMAADVVIAEVRELVEPGAIDPERVGTPAVFVDRIVQCEPIPVELDG